MDTGVGLCYGECCELYRTDKSQTCTRETNNTLYVFKKSDSILTNQELNICISYIS